jgi:type II secretion system protein G
MKKLSKFRGFTLVELLVVMSIIGILATVILGGFRASQRRARDTKRKSDLQQVAKALEMFYNDHERYPDSNAGKLVACEYVEGGTSDDCDWGQGQFSDGNTTYFRQMPDDLSGSNYYYRALDSNKAFQLYTHLENPEDRGCIVGATNEPDCLTPVLPASPPSCGGVCNFAVTSTNVTPAQD